MPLRGAVITSIQSTRVEAMPTRCPSHSTNVERDDLAVARPPRVLKPSQSPKADRLAGGVTRRAIGASKGASCHGRPRPSAMIPLRRPRRRVVALALALELEGGPWQRLFTSTGFR